MPVSFLRCAISNRNLAQDSRDRIAPEADPLTRLERQAQLLAEDNVNFLQLREKDLPPSQLVALARALLQILHGTSTTLLINSRVDVAIACGAPGVHLPSSPEELTPIEVHRLYASAGLPSPLVTVSCHTLEDIARQRGQPLTAILFGPVFGKQVAGSHVADGTGLSLLEQACRAAMPVPVLALGGVTTANTPACLAAGAAGVAGIRLFQPGPALQP